MAENTVKFWDRIKSIDIVSILFSLALDVILLCITLLLICIILECVLIAVGFTLCASENGLNQSSLGVIKDFEVSAGGFGHSDKCKVVLEDKSIVIDGSVCSTLQTGKCLYETKCSNLYSISDCKNGSS